ncbi:N-acetyltransferase family protein [Roseobacteraceae bacterium S113]
MKEQVTVRSASPADEDVIWEMLRPVFRAGDTYAVDPGISREDALGYWLAEHVFLAEIDGTALGTFYIQRNRPGGGSHYCNCGFVTAPAAQGRGVARAMLEQALVRAGPLGFEGMVFNFVVANNTRAVATWEKAGFYIIGRVPGAFRHPQDGDIDALVMFRKLD